MASISNRSRAFRNPTTHVFVSGRGYIDVGGLQHSPSIAPVGRCNPVRDTANMSYHFLVPPGGHPPIVFQWVSGAWMTFSNRSKRLGYAPDYLSRAGWTYGSPAAGLHGGVR